VPTEQDVRRQVNQLARVGQLVHLAMRYDIDHEEALRAQLLKERKAAYEGELTRLAAQAGCTRSARLSNGPILSALNEASKEDAASIVRTFNADLARTIAAIRLETPTANRHVYARRLLAWEAARGNWKGPQVAMNTRGDAVQRAQDDFLRLNNMAEQVEAQLVPRVGVCPICQGLIAMGWVSKDVADANPAPIHVGCPHVWVYRKVPKVRAGECTELWLGE
jgi:hypothetical protein